VRELIEENKILKEEVLFWNYFYSESIRLYGDKKDELEPMLKKIMSLIQLDCRAKATVALKDKGTKNKKQKTKSGFNVDKFMEYCDGKTQDAYSKKYPPIIHVEYLDLIGYGKALDENKQDDIDYETKIAALKILQKKYNNDKLLSSFVKTLERKGVSNLPPIRTVENNDD
jgi:hypothetical protein